MKFNYQQFYIELGKLLYVIAKADGIIQVEEIKDLHQLVREELTKIEKSTDEFGTNAAFYTEFEFETQVDSKADVDEAYHSFLKFMKANKNFINTDLKRICLSSVNKIAESYEGIVGSEMSIIQRLEHDLASL